MMGIRTKEKAPVNVSLVIMVLCAYKMKNISVTHIITVMEIQNTQEANFV